MSISQDVDVEMDKADEAPKVISLADESALWDLHDPTSMNVNQQLNALLAVLPAEFDAHENLKQAFKEERLLPALSHYLRKPSCTLAVTEAFRPLLMDLCVRWIDDANGSEENLDTLEALALLIEAHDELFP